MVKPRPASKKAAPKPKRKPPSKGPAPDTLPASLANALPTAVHMMKLFSQAFALRGQLEKELKRAEKGGAVPLARAFVVFHRMKARVGELGKPIFGEDQLYDRYKSHVIPEIFDAAGVPNVTLAEGFRVGKSSRFFAMIRKGETDGESNAIKQRAYDWLRANGLESIIQPVVNVSTLSSAAKELIEEQNRELPKDLFEVAMVPNTSVTKT